MTEKIDAALWRTAPNAVKILNNFPQNRSLNTADILTTTFSLKRKIVCDCFSPRSRKKCDAWFWR